MARYKNPATVDIDQQIKYANKEHMRRIDELNLSRSVADFLIPIANLWSGGRTYKSSKWHRAASICVTGWGSVDMVVKLSAQDTIPSLLPLIEMLYDRYTFKRTQDSPKYHYRTFYFKTLSDINVELKVEFKSSSACKTVKTGKLIEEETVECTYI